MLNNNTLMDALAAHHHEENLDFFTQDAQLQCVLHTIHLAVLKIMGGVFQLLEGIGAISASDSTCAISKMMQFSLRRRKNPQQISSSVNWVDMAFTILQRCKAWLQDVTASLYINLTSATSLILILDVKTQWSSTHQMLCHALMHKEILNEFIRKHHNHDLLQYDLTPTHWNAIEAIEKWLKNFHFASVQMSTTSHLMLSTTLAMFCGLQENLHTIISTIPTDTPTVLCDSLVSLHLELNPHIGYDAIEEDYKDNLDLLKDLQHSCIKLQQLFDCTYK
ncbi:hypothetical protein BDN71DRAFT_1430170 [Pleurotus eryngii]|uniref:Uncharacterized protein n=1 Tax=Pleurotus eryngii TaxID=5323 RepID=A0A9P6A3J8_PLEER|nr:hypothetical protein BDN71DRAFT_1430170 [Pleurotus eryngii]